MSRITRVIEKKKETKGEEERRLIFEKLQEELGFWAESEKQSEDKRLMAIAYDALSDADTTSFVLFVAEWDNLKKCYKPSPQRKNTKMEMEALLAAIRFMMDQNKNGFVVVPEDMDKLTAAVDEFCSQEISSVSIFDLRTLAENIGKIVIDKSWHGKIAWVHTPEEVSDPTLKMEKYGAQSSCLPSWVPQDD